MYLHKFCAINRYGRNKLQRVKENMNATFKVPTRNYSYTKTTLPKSILVRWLIRPEVPEVFLDLFLRLRWESREAFCNCKFDAFNSWRRHESEIQVQGTHRLSFSPRLVFAASRLSHLKRRKNQEKPLGPGYLFVCCHKKIQSSEIYLDCRKLSFVFSIKIVLSEK